MSTLIDRMAYAPALLAWILFAPLFRLAHWVRPYGSKGGTWYWCGVEATDHATKYDGYDS